MVFTKVTVLYSEDRKSLYVSGSSYKIRNKLRDLGGRWNAEKKQWEFTLEETGAIKSKLDRLAQGVNKNRTNRCYKIVTVHEGFTGGVSTGYRQLRMETKQDYEKYLQELRGRWKFCDEDECSCREDGPGEEGRGVCRLCQYACCKDAIRRECVCSGVSIDCNTCNKGYTCYGTHE